MVEAPAKIGTVRVVDLTLRKTPDMLYRGVEHTRFVQTPIIPLGRQLVLKTGETATFNPFKTRFIWDNQG